MRKVNCYSNILKKGTCFSFVIPSVNNINANALEKEIKKIKSEIIEKYSLGKIVKSNPWYESSNIDDILKYYEIFGLNCTEKDCKKFYGERGIKNYNLEDNIKIKKILDSKHSIIDYLADNENNFELKGNVDNIEIGYLKLKILRTIEKDIFDNYGRNDVQEKLYKILEKYTILGDIKIYKRFCSVFLMSEFISMYDSLFYLDDFIEFRKKLKYKNSDVFDDVANQNFINLVLNNSDNIGPYFIRKLFNYIKENNSIPKEVVENIKNEIKNYKNYRNNNNNKCALESFKYFVDDISFFYDENINIYEGYKFYYKSIDQIKDKFNNDVYEYLEKNNKIYKDLVAYYEFYEKNKEHLIDIENIVDYYMNVFRFKNSDGIINSDISEFKEIKEKYKITKAGDFENLKNSLDSIPDGNIKKSFCEKINKDYGYFQNLSEDYKKLEKEILEKFIDNLKPKVNKLKDLNNSLVESDKEDLDKYNEDFFKNLSLNDFNKNNSIDEIETINLHIDSKIIEYKNRKINLKTKFESIVNINNKIKEVGSIDYKIKIDKKYNADFFSNLNYKDIHTIETEINKLEEDVNKAKEDFGNALKEKIENDKKNEEKRAKIEKAENTQKKIKTEIEKVCNSYLEEIKGLNIDEKFGKSTIPTGLDQKITELYSNKGYKEDNLTDWEDINNKLISDIQQLKSECINKCNDEIDKKLKEIADRKVKELAEQQKKDKEEEDKKQKELEEQQRLAKEEAAKKAKEEQQKKDKEEEDKLNNNEEKQDIQEQKEVKTKTGTCCKKCSSEKCNKKN